MRATGARAALLAAAVVALATAGSAFAQETGRGIDPNQGQEPRRGASRQQGRRDRAAAQGRGLRHRLQRALSAARWERWRDRHRLRQRGGARRARGRRLQRRPHDRGPCHLARPRCGLAGGREGREDRGGRRARRGLRRGCASRRHRRAPRRLLRELRGPVPLRRGEGRHPRIRDHRRVARALVEHGRGHGDRPGPADDERQHRPGHHAGHVHRAPDPREGRRGQQRDAAGADADPHRVEPGRVRGGRREHLARRWPPADELELPQQLHDPLSRPDGALRTLPRACRRVPGPHDAHPAAVQDQRVPAAGPGADGGADESRVHGQSQRRDRGAGRHPHVEGVGTRGRERPHGGVRHRRAELTAHGDDARQRPACEPRDECDGCAHEHGCTGSGRDQRDPGRFREARRPDVPGQRRRRHRAATDQGQPVRLPWHWDERARPARAVRVLRDADRQEPARLRAPTRGFTGGASASSSTASSTPASGRRR